MSAAPTRRSPAVPGVLRQQPASSAAAVGRRSLPAYAVRNICLLSLALLSGQIGRTLEDFVGSSVAMHGPTAVAMVLLLVFVSGRRSTAAKTCRSSQRMLLAAYAVIGLATISTLNAITEHPTAPVQKLFGMILVVFAMARAARLMTADQIRIALLLFAVIEASAILVLNPLIGWNPNALSMRVAICGFIGYALFADRRLRLASALMGIYIPFHFLCRTAAIASINSFIAEALNRHLQRDRILVIVLGIPLLLLVVFYAEELTNSGADFAHRMLGSDHALARFFLHDKNADRLENDFLNRGDIWTASLELIRERPWFGVGLGNESLYMSLRSHNAWLGATAEGGIPYAMAWLVLTCLIFKALLSALSGLRDSQSRLAICGLLIGVYLVAAGLVETSGLASVSTPGSQIFYLLGFWFAYRAGVKTSHSPSTADVPKTMNAEHSPRL